MKKNGFLLLLFIPVTLLQAQELQPVTLKQPDKTSGATIMQAFENRASVLEFTEEEISPDDLSGLLWAANGINRPGTGKRTAPSAMNSQDIDVYAVTKEGVYLYDAATHTLQPVVAGDLRTFVANRQANFAKAPLFLVLVSDLSRFTRGDESQKPVWGACDAGIVSQNISLYCAGTGLATRPRASMNQEKLREALKLKESQILILNHPVAYPAK